MFSRLGADDRLEGPRGPPEAALHASPSRGRPSPGPAAAARGGQPVSPCRAGPRPRGPPAASAQGRTRGPGLRVPRPGPRSVGRAESRLSRDAVTAAQAGGSRKRAPTTSSRPAAALARPHKRAGRTHFFFFSRLHSLDPAHPGLLSDTLRVLEAWSQPCVHTVTPTSSGRVRVLRPPCHPQRRGLT